MYRKLLSGICLYLVFGFFGFVLFGVFWGGFFFAWGKDVEKDCGSKIAGAWVLKKTGFLEVTN